MKTLKSVILISSIAFAVNTSAQNAADNSNNARQAPTIEDQLTQLQQDQQGLAGRVNALDKKLASIEQEIRTLEDQTSGSSGNSSKGPADQPNEASAPSNDSANSTTNATSGASPTSYDVFYDRLQSDGQWFSDPTYGYVWQPAAASSDQNWRPYTDGRWAYTDRGWTWVSNENSGWATYHYGRWARLSDKGWIWVPGSTWAPAWVSWRESDDYVGWAPLPPEAQSQQNVRIEGWADNYYNIGPGGYVFLKTTDLGNRSYRGIIASSQDNIDIISRTKNVTSIYSGKAGIVDNGPDYDRLVQNSNVKIDRYRLNFVQQNDPGARFGAATQGDQLQVVAPATQLQRAASVQPKIAGNIANTQVDRGWQNIDEAKAKQLKQTWEKQAPVPAGLPANPAAPKPVFARLTGQGQGNNQQPATEMRQPGQSNQGPNNTPPNAAPAPSPSPNANPGQAGQQPPTPNENRRHELNQGQRPETTPPAPSPSENERSLQRPERKKATPSPEHQRRQTEGENVQSSSGETDSPGSKTGRTPQSDENRGGSQNFDSEAPTGANDQKGMPQREEKAGRESRNAEEPTTKGEGQQSEGYRNSEKSNSGETQRSTSGDRNGQGREQSEKEKPGGNRRPEQSEKQQVEPSGQ